VQILWSGSEAAAGALLCVLLLWQRCLPANSGGGVLLRLSRALAGVRGYPPRTVSIIN
jgi:hypothetical protein